MKKLFISQPMRGKTGADIQTERDAAILAAKKLIGEDVEVLETFYDDFHDDAKPLEFLARAIWDLAKADIVYFAPGWDEARGCKIEHECAVAYDIATIDGTAAV